MPGGRCRKTMNTPLSPEVPKPKPQASASGRGKWGVVKRKQQTSSPSLTSDDNNENISNDKLLQRFGLDKLTAETRDEVMVKFNQYQQEEEVSQRIDAGGDDVNRDDGMDLPDYEDSDESVEDDVDAGHKGGRGGEPRAQIASSPPAPVVSAEDDDMDGMPEIDFGSPGSSRNNWNNTNNTADDEGIPGNAGQQDKSMEKQDNVRSADRANTSGHSGVTVRRKKHNRRTWCTPCQWLQRCGEVKGCDGGQPCSQCTIEMQKRQTTWECKYEGGINNKGTNLPDIYRMRPLAKKKNSKSPATTTTTNLTPTSSAQRQPLTPASTVPTPTTAIADPTPSASTTTAANNSNVFTPENTSITSTTPSNDFDTPMSNYDTTDKPSISSVRELVEAIRGDVILYHELRNELDEESEDEDDEMKNKLDQCIAIFEQKLEDPMLAKYLSREERISKRDIPLDIKEGLLAANFKDCMGKRDWRGMEEM